MKNHFSATPDLTSGSEVLQAEITSLKQRVADLQAQTKHLANSALEAQEKLKQSEASLKTLNQLKTDLEKRTKETKQLAAKYEDANQENELLLLQLMQAQEELVEYYEQKGQFEKLYEGYKSRWDRLEKRLPDYVDFGAVELVGFDNVSDIPSLTWRIKEYAHAGVAIDELQFVTVLNDGHPGIGLVTDKEEPAVFVPQHLAKSANDVSHFLSYSASAYKQISVIALIFEQLEASQWQGFAFPANFDASFWRPPLKTLMAQLKALPPVLRYDDVVLKRELINPDYEHLWLEFKGLALGHTAWRKFEVRLGAALVQPTGFSQYPKFEFPLIDGKTKPFESWYAESHDDSGAKLELRFALDKQAFDNAVLAKLNDADRGLLLRLISAFPDALKRLSNKKTAIHRPWETWIGFASDAAKLLKASRAAVAAEPAKPVEAPARGVKASPSADTSTMIPANKVVGVTSRGGAEGSSVKVLSFKAKTPPAKAGKLSVAKPAAKNKAKEA